MSVQTFWLEPTDRLAIGLRRYSLTEGCPAGRPGYHNAVVYQGEDVGVRDEHGGIRLKEHPEVDHTYSGWPTHCACGYEFTEDDEWQVWTESIWVRTDTGEDRGLRTRDMEGGLIAAEPGAMWNASWMPSRRTDGLYLMVRCPDGHDWAVDSQCSNCTRPGEDHECWVRHGDPRACHVTVDKNGNTCSAGAGSILTPTWHGFLRDGVLVDC